MGIDTNVHVGWYIKAQKRYMMVNEDFWRCEASLSHEVRPEYNNCPECGAEVICRKKKKRVEMNCYDLDEDLGFLEDRFYYPEYMTLKEDEVLMISNLGVGNYRISNDGEIYNIMSEDQATLYTEFIQEHEHDMKLLNDVYDHVQLLYGAFIYYT